MGGWVQGDGGWESLFVGAGGTPGGLSTPLGGPWAGWGHRAALSLSTRIFHVRFFLSLVMSAP